MRPYVKICDACQNIFESNNWLCINCGHEPGQINGFYQFASEIEITDVNYPAEAFSQLSQIEANHFWFLARNKLIAWAFKKYFATAQNFLEIGCGTGFVLLGLQQAFPTLKTFGSEIHVNGLQVAANRVGKANLFQMDAHKIPFKEEFDVIGSFDVLEHIENDASILGQIFQALKPRGGLILTVPQHPFLWSQTDEAAGHVRRYTKKELKVKLAKAGFTILAMRSFVSLLFPAMLLSRLTMNHNKKEFDLKDEFVLNKNLNALFSMMMSCEIAAIKLGLRFPFGGSLLVIAQKIER